jgi:hypothetical protein
MGWRAYCLERAERCDQCADAIDDPDLETLLRQMAQDWRSAATTLDDPPIVD